MNSINTVSVLSSGGIDSTACIHYYMKLGFNIELLFIDYNHKAKINEYKAVKKIAKYYKVKLSKSKVQSDFNFDKSEILGRNAAFCFLALMHFKHRSGLIAMGIHSGTGYFDCSQEFLIQMQRLVEGYSGATISFEAPFINFTKMDIMNYCKMEQIPIHITYSCETGDTEPCGKCATCKDIMIFYANENK